MTIYMPISDITLGSAKSPPDTCRYALCLHITLQRKVDESEPLPANMTWLHPAAGQDTP